MAGRFVRASKYRHVYGQQTRKEQCYDNIRVSRNAWDTNLVKVNPKYISVNWDASGGGAFAVIPLEERGRLPERIPLFRGHTAVVLDTDWNPFNDELISSGSDDGKIFLWRVPDNFKLRSDLKPDEIQDVKPVGKLSGHSKKVGHVAFNTAAENVLASASGDFTVKIWDIEAGSPKLNLKVGEVIQSLSWSANGSLLVTTSRDKKLRIWDTRQEKPAHEVMGHGGAKNSRAVWMGEHDRIATTGFSRMSDRQLALWDIKSPNQPVNGFELLDSISGVCMPFWDDGTQCLYLAGKGDGNIRYYEYENDKFEYLSEYKSGDPQRGIAFMPKRGVNMHENEVTRTYKTVNDSYIEPISFIVPRRSESFQDDIYPPTVGMKPAMSSKEWFDGAEGVPPKISMESLYDGAGLKEASADELRPVTKAPETAKVEPKPAVKKEPETPASEPTTSNKGPAPTMKEQGGSMAAMVGKYADNEPVEDESDDDSSFEEVQKPSERAAPKSVTTVPTQQTPKAEEKTTPKPTEASKPSPPAPEPEVLTATQPEEVSNTEAGGAKDGLERELRSLKSVLAQQTRQLTALTKVVQDLAAEVKALKSS